MWVPQCPPACPLTWTTVDVASHCVPSRLKVSTVVPWREPCCRDCWAEVLDVGTTGEQAEAPCGSGARLALASLATLQQELEMSFCGSDTNFTWISLLSWLALPWFHIIPGLTYELRAPFAIHTWLMQWQSPRKWSESTLSEHWKLTKVLQEFRKV